MALRLSSLQENGDSHPYEFLEPNIPSQLDTDFMSLITSLESEMARVRQTARARDSKGDRVILVGVTTGYMPSIGVALMAAVPPRSRRMWRVDFAVPLDRSTGAQFGVRFSYEDRTRSFWREPNDVHRNRERSGARTAFVVP